MIKSFSPNVIIEESTRIFMWELNIVYDVGVESLGNKKNKRVIYNRLKYFTKGSLVHPCTLSIFYLYT